MNLLQKQQEFPHFLAELFQFCWRNGYELTVGEAWRSDETASLYAKQGKGIADSLHRLRLAIDLNLFRGGNYLTETKDYQVVGEYWESLSLPESGVECCWGGRFLKSDANHFSVSHNGIK
jgi:hypothetical protein